MSDRILISRLQLDVHLGVPEVERTAPQRILVSVEIEAETQAAARRDDLGLTIDYYAVSNELKRVAALRPRKLIEALAEDFAAAILRFRGVMRTTVLIEKFILPDADSVAVRIERGRAS